MAGSPMDRLSTAHAVRDDFGPSEPAPGATPKTRSLRPGPILGR